MIYVAFIMLKRVSGKSKHNYLETDVYYTVMFSAPVGGRPVHRTATYRCDDTRGCIIQFYLMTMSTWCSKNVEARNKLIVKQILCIKLVNY